MNAPASGSPKGAGQSRGGPQKSGSSKGGPPANGANANGAGSNRKRRNRKRRNRSGTKATAEFWGDVASLPEPRDDIRITSDPAAVVRSLGRAPLPGQEQVSEAYFEAVYARAVGLASALAAAGELIEPAELLED